MSELPGPDPADWDDFEDETTLAVAELSDLAEMPPLERLKTTRQMFPWFSGWEQHRRGTITRGRLDALCESQAAFIVANRLALDHRPFLELSRLVSDAYCDLPERPDIDPIWLVKADAERLSRTLRFAAKLIEYPKPAEAGGFAAHPRPEAPKSLDGPTEPGSPRGGGRCPDHGPSEAGRTTAPTVEELAEAFRRHGKKGQRLAAKLIEFMADRQSATSETILREVHDHQGTDCTRVKALVRRTNDLLEEYGADFRYKKGAGHVLKVLPGFESEESPICSPFVADQ